MLRVAYDGTIPHAYPVRHVSPETQFQSSLAFAEAFGESVMDSRFKPRAVRKEMAEGVLQETAGKILHVM